MAAALCIPPVLALAQTPASHALPAGTRLDFVADDAVNIETVRPGGQFRVHLAAPLVLDGAPLAPAGTAARLLITEKRKRSDGSTGAVQIALAGFRLKAGELPVAPLAPAMTAIAPGTVIAATTQGSIERAGDRIVISVPVPMPLSIAAPAAAFTAYPAVTPAPLRSPAPRGATPTALPTTFNPPPDAAPETATTPGAPVSAEPSP